MVETDAAFNEFDADGVIRALLPDLLPEEPDALHVLRNAAQHRSEFQRLFALMVQRWHDGEHADNGLETWHSFTSRVQGGLQRVLDSAAAAIMLLSSPRVAPLPPCSTWLPVLPPARRSR